MCSFCRRGYCADGSGMGGGGGGGLEMECDTLILQEMMQWGGGGWSVMC